MRIYCRGRWQVLKNQQVQCHLVFVKNMTQRGISANREIQSGIVAMVSDHWDWNASQF